MPVEKVARKLRIARERIVPRVRRKIAIQIRIIRKQLIRDAAALNRPRWISRFVVIIRAHIGPKRICMPDKLSSSDTPSALFRNAQTRAPRAFAGKMVHFLKMHQNRHIHLTPPAHTCVVTPAHPPPHETSIRQTRARPVSAPPSRLLPHPVS